MQTRHRRSLGLALTIVATLLSVSSCTRKDLPEGDPRRRLEDYVRTSFNVRDVGDREKLLGFLTAGAKNRLAAWSDEQFRQAFIDSKRQFLTLSIREVKSVSPSQTNLTYELSYVDQGRGNEARVTNKRMTEMVLEQGHWMIREVHNIKELVEYKNEMSLP